MVLAPSILQEQVGENILIPLPEEPDLSDENPLILIFPYKGNVWEVDSLDGDGPLYLGQCGSNWVETALPRLIKWKETVNETLIPVDIQAITLEKI